MLLQEPERPVHVRRATAQVVAAAEAAAAHRALFLRGGHRGAGLGGAPGPRLWSAAGTGDSEAFGCSVHKGTHTSPEKSQTSTFTTNHRNTFPVMYERQWNTSIEQGTRNIETI